MKFEENSNRIGISTKFSNSKENDGNGKLLKKVLKSLPPIRVRIKRNSLNGKLSIFAILKFFQMKNIYDRLHESWEGEKVLLKGSPNLSHKIFRQVEKLKQATLPQYGFREFINKLFHLFRSCPCFQVHSPFG